MNFFLIFISFIDGTIPFIGFVDMFNCDLYLMESSNKTISPEYMFSGVLGGFISYMMGFLFKESILESVLFFFSVDYMSYSIKMVEDFGFILILLKGFFLPVSSYSLMSFFCGVVKKNVFLFLLMSFMSSLSKNLFLKMCFSGGFSTILLFMMSNYIKLFMFLKVMPFFFKKCYLN